MKNKFTKRFKETLKQTNLTQKELAEKCYISKQAITDFKTGRALPSIETLYLICEALDESADYLIGLENETGKNL